MMGKVPPDGWWCFRTRFDILYISKKDDRPWNLGAVIEKWEDAIMENVINEISQAVLWDLGIYHRKFSCEQGMLYFCSLPNGMTFDLLAGNDGTVKLWRFVADLPDQGSYIKWEYQNPDWRGLAVGLEITQEGDVCLYAQQQLAVQDPHSRGRLQAIIRGYMKMMMYLQKP